MTEILANGDISINTVAPEKEQLVSDIFKLANYYIGSRTIKEKLSDFYKQHPDNFCISYGIDIIFHHILSTLNFKSILCFYPSYPYGEYSANLLNYNVIRCELNENGTYPKQIPLEIVSKQPQIVLIINPSNPIGLTINENILSNYLKILPNSLFIIDEAYIDFCENKSIFKIAIQNERIIILRSFSKGYGLPGIRIGYAFSVNQNLIKKINDSRFFFLTSFSFKMAIWALENKATLIETINLNFQIKSQLINVINNFPLLEILPTETNFILVRLDKSVDKKRFQDLCDRNKLTFWWFNENELFQNYFGQPSNHAYLLNTFRISCIEERKIPILKERLSIAFSQI